MSSFLTGSTTKYKRNSDIGRWEKKEGKREDTSFGSKGEWATGEGEKSKERKKEKEEDWSPKLIQQPTHPQAPSSVAHDDRLVGHLRRVLKEQTTTTATTTSRLESSQCPFQVGALMIVI